MNMRRSFSKDTGEVTRKILSVHDLVGEDANSTLRINDMMISQSLWTS